jgi:nitroreductase
MELNQVFEQRRSVNFFDTGKKIDEETIRRIYDIAKLAPSSFNLQPWKIILVSDAEQKEKLKKCAGGQPKVTEASHVAIVLGDKKAYEKMDPTLDDFIARGFFGEQMRETLKGMAKGLYAGDNERAFASRNAGLFAMSFMLAAKSLGVDTHPMDGMDNNAVREAFNVPDDYDVVMLIAIGKHDEAKALLPRASRKPFDEVFVKETL